MFRINYVLLMVTLSLFTANTWSQDLSQKNIDDYLKFLELVQQSEDPVIQSIEASIENSENINLALDSEGKIGFTQQMLAALSSSQKAALNALIESASLPEINQFAVSADNIMAAMIALEIKKNPVDTSAFNPEMISQLPAEVQQQIKSAMQMFEAVKSVPQSDINLVKKNYSKLQEIMQN